MFQEPKENMDLQWVLQIEGKGRIYGVFVVEMMIPRKIEHAEILLIPAASEAVTMAV